MRSQRVFQALVVAALAFLPGCSSSTTPSGSGYFSWSIGGTNFAADGAPGLIQGNVGGTGLVILTGTKVTGTDTQSVSLALGFIPGKGKFPMGVNQGTTPGGSATRSLTTSSPATFKNWTTPLSGDIRNSVTITDVSSSVITGTFDFFVEPDGGSTATGTIHIENGKFSVPLTGFALASASDPGSTFTIDKVNGSKFIGATNVGVGTPSTFSFGASNSASLTTPFISINLLSVVPTSPGTTYPILTGIKIQVVIGSSGFGGVSGDSGSVTIDSVSGKYLKGHFGTVTLVGSGGSVTLEGGNFNVKIG